MSEFGTNKGMTAQGAVLALDKSHPTNTMSNQGSVLYRPPKAAPYVGLSVSTLAKARLRGDGPKFVRLSARAIGYLQADLDDWLAAKRFGSTSEYGSAATSGPVK